MNALAVGVSVSLALLAFELLHQPGIPLAGGYASLFVPGNPYAPADQFRLDLVMDQPGSTYVEYHVTAGCGTRARHVLLVLSGDARLADPRYTPSAGEAMTTRPGKPALEVLPGSRPACSDRDRDERPVAAGIQLSWRSCYGPGGDAGGERAAEQAAALLSRAGW